MLESGKIVIFNILRIQFQPEACPGFILVGAETIFMGGRKEFKGGKNIFSSPLKNFSALLAEFDSAPGAEETRGGAELKRERKIHRIIGKRDRAPN